MRNLASVSTLAIIVASVSSGTALAQTANISGSSATILNLLSPFLSLNATAVGQQTLTSNLNQVVVLNNGANTARQSLAISDKNLLGSVSNNLSSVGLGTYGIAANLAGGLPAQTPINGITPQQPVGGYGSVLGPIYQTGVAGGTSGALGSVVTLLGTAYSYTGSDLGVAKNYFANGAATNPSTTPANYVPVPAVAPAGFSVPAYNGLPNTTDSVYDLAYGVKSTQPGQDVYGSSRPVQVAPGRINQFDPTSLNGIATNPSFPSGHTTYAFTDSILLGMLAPQLYQSMMVRAAEYGDSRIVLGVHYPLDIIGGRALASYDLAQALSNPAYLNNAAMTGSALNMPSLFTAAYAQMQGYLSAQCGASVAACATSAANTANDPYVPSAANQAFYQSRLTYGLPTLSYDQAPREQAPAGAADASILLATVYGGSTSAAQTLAPNGGIYGNLATGTINQILVNTEGQALAAFYGTTLSYWTRIDLYSAVGYFDNVTGTLKMATSDRLTRDVTVGNTGALYANGTITGAVTVGSGGLLGGNGTVGGFTAQRGGTIAPGNSIGTLNVSGNATFQQGSTYQVEINSAGQSDRVAATGTIAVNGANLQVIAASGTYSPTTTYSIFTAGGGVSGSFANASSNFLFLSPSLTFSGTGGTMQLQRNGVAFASQAITANETATATGLDQAGWSNPVYALLASSQTGAVLAPGFDALSGEAYASANTVMQEQSIFLRDAVGSRLRQATGTAPGGPATAALAPGLTPTLWLQGFGSWGNNSGNLNTASVSSDIGGFFAGADVAVTDNWRVGLVGGYSQSTFQVDARNSSGSIDNYDLGLYAGGQYGAIGLHGGLTYTWHDGSMSRAVVFPGYVGGNSASFNAGTTQLFGEVSYDVALAPAVISPYAGLAYVHLSTDGYTENGSTSALAGNTSNEDTLFSTLGARLRADLTLAPGAVVTPTATVAWLHAFGDVSPTATQTFAGALVPFQVTGTPLARDAALLGAGLDYRVTTNTLLSVNYTGQYSGTATANGLNGALTVKF